MKKESDIGFTLMELMVVVVIIGIIAGFALPQYQKSVRKSHERDALVQLATLHAANAIYRAKEDEYLPAAANLAAINSGLNINIIANQKTYTYTRNSTITYTATAFWDDPNNSFDFRVQIENTAIDNNNPCCHSSTAGQCPTLPDC